MDLDHLWNAQSVELRDVGKVGVIVECGDNHRSRVECGGDVAGSPGGTQRGFDFGMRGLQRVELDQHRAVAGMQVA